MAMLFYGWKLHEFVPSRDRKIKLNSINQRYHRVFHCTFVTHKKMMIIYLHSNKQKSSST